MITTKEKITPGEEVLKVEKLAYVDKFKIPKLSGVSLSVRRGEIVGIAGVEGNGQSELISIITGNMRAIDGRVFFKRQGYYPGIGDEHPQDRYVPCTGRPYDERMRG